MVSRPLSRKMGSVGFQKNPSWTVLCVVFCMRLCLTGTNKQKAPVTHLGFVETVKYPQSWLLTPSVVYYARSFWGHNGDETAECGRQQSWPVQNFPHKRAASFSLVAYRYEQCLYRAFVCLCQPITGLLEGAAPPLPHPQPPQAVRVAGSSVGSQWQSQFN